MDYNFLILFTMYLHQPRGPGVKDLWCCETKTLHCWSKKRIIQQEKAPFGVDILPGRD